MKRRNTAAKQTILDILQASRSVPLSQEDIEQKVAGKMNRVTVYRVLNSFYEDGYIHKILADDGKYYFAICLNCREDDHHHDHFHFRCLNCQKVECLQEEVKVQLPGGYRQESVNCLITGYCPECA
ncbi:Fur family transcriptional regulator [Flavilitoribacter nigricans]|uniref:Transcriptional regulator n=1 Tax=Flavilitoribacter nigricans (strain ATCC 23147 / DSM 23189 / NBRC 102662 / NCIMB 1420 / SS-2) TaxID=1122177 RepID=A0A2D0N4R4_FLAN2|nr:transcriptional repressor [Flavilitoribacter nigricans]PHN03511.1 transcriptional regulator [Flavilitoribacter nigricans DSM 23189 = NBRC 102662]